MHQNQRRYALDGEALQQFRYRIAVHLDQPHVGLELGDSAESVYRAALTALGLGDKIKNVHASALAAILDMQPLPDRRPKAPIVAMDSAGAKSFAERFPDANRIKII
jgi:hypothetical protein